ncbi:MAG: DinB family protein [Gemmatimonadaceae bacterium]
MSPAVLNAPWSAVALARWSEIGDKIVQLAEEFPQEKYDARPTPEVRSFADQLRHVAFWNAHFCRALRREDSDGSANELSREKYPVKGKIVAALRKSFDDVKAELSNGGREVSDLDGLITYVGHNGEHYGQLVVYYRLNGLVPPASR